MRYKYLGSNEVHIPEVGKTVLPGDVIECEGMINHPDFVPVTANNEPAPVEMQPDPNPETAAPAQPDAGKTKKLKK